jgi:hypothetical protein
MDELENGILTWQLGCDLFYLSIYNESVRWLAAKFYATLLYRLGVHENVKSRQA